ncbi:uncharacterized protein PHACADRAFT_265757 [Phanerochaete carnosa HHB-10118-sp]|uniref:C2H2-type domain-containing protein n=1 Tax=Phanerochaete carnosa (strain HHB-10118-sp) TaxID=650164 RepID=K5UI53_PHACS|nr:uncharacterized protein PHACADRAFT_265757 [Phanerochaete carnosa HHB-10118-sp]EKM49201.1 hypothetical protein PHACADRAFT_265757 [Phanerochaete carnosa HHB-10118-sp]
MQEINRQSYDQPQHLNPQTANQSPASASQQIDQSQPFYPGSNRESSGISYALVPQDSSSSPPRLSHPPVEQSAQESIRNANRQQYIHPTRTITPYVRRDHHQRSSLGSRGRPLGWNNDIAGSRASPYSSPGASPWPAYYPLPSGHELGMSIPMQRRPMSADFGMPLGGLMDGAGTNMQVGADTEAMAVTEVNVTTPSTADASQKRRKQPANFTCPIPGCGSTFARHFNLTGHLRSHAEEKLYQCKWPGCGKGFARYPDCKRHEQLHLNVRSYPCEGCKKKFAELDGLSLHCE